MSLGPNDLLPCPSETARKRHLALAEHCAACGTLGRRNPLPSVVELKARRRAALDRAAQASTRPRLVVLSEDAL